VDDGQAAALRPDELAAKLETAVVDPVATTESVASLYRECAAAGAHAVVVRPADVEVCARYATPETVLAVLCGYPHGWQSTAVKVFEARDLIRRGARRVDVVANLAKLQSREFSFVETELIQLAQACHEGGAKLRVILQAHLLGEEQKLVACKIAKRSETDEAIAAMGPSKPEDEAILRKKCPPYVQVCTFARDLNGALSALQQGFSFVSTPSPAALRKEYQARLEAPQSAS
jgi:deoxyribose-phosphate aldolase